MILQEKVLITNNRVYDFLKYLTQIVLPALATLYFTLAQIWGLPNAEEVVGTLVAVVTFLGVILGLSSAAYNKSEHRFDGSIDVTEGENEKLFTLNLDGDPDELDRKDEVVFKVQTIKDNF